MEGAQKKKIYEIHEPLYGLNPKAKYHTKVVCHPAAQITSSGFWMGDSPLFFTLPVMLLQCSIVLILSRTLRILLRPLKQPSIVADVLAGVIAGPLLRGQFKSVHSFIFPDFAIFNTSSVATFGVIYYMFLIGVRIDTSAVLKGNKKTMIGLSGIIISVAAAALVILPLASYTTQVMADGPFYASLSSSLGTSAFPVVHQLLAEFRLLNTELGRVSLSIALVNHVFGWMTLLFLESVQDGVFRAKSLVVHLSLAVGFVVFALVVIRPIMRWIIRRTPEGKSVESGYVVGILVGVLVMSLATDAVGLSMLEGAMILGLVIPDGPPLGSTLTEKTETVMNNLMLPFFFLNSAVYIDLWNVKDWRAVGVVAAAVLAASIAKLVGTVVVGVSCHMQFHDAFSVGVVLCSKGMIELITYNHWAIYKLLDNQVYAALMVTTVTITAVVSPVVKSLTVSSRPLIPYTWHTIQHSKPHAELRVLACIHQQEHVPPMLTLLDCISDSTHNPVCIYAMHVVELVGRATPLLIAHKPHKKPIVSSVASNSIFAAFRSFERQFEGNVFVQPFTSISPEVSMHKDVCSVALERKVGLILIPFQKQRSVDGGFNSVDPVIHVLNPNVLREAPCSVGIVVDRGNPRGRFSRAVISTSLYNVAVFFLGGPDDREALSYAAHMAGHPRVTLTVWRFLSKESVGEHNRERRTDDDFISHFREKNAGNGRVVYKEVLLTDGEEMLNILRNMEDLYDVVMVGRFPSMNGELVEGLSLWSENPELGPLGDLCSSSDFFGSKASVLIMQQQIARRSHS